MTQYKNQILLKELPKLFIEHMNDYDVYFTTVTFNNIHHELSKASYESTLKALYQKVNQLSMNNPTKKPQLKAKMVMIAEESHPSRVSNMCKAKHCHGFLMIHKANNEKFKLKCIKGEGLSDKVTKQSRLGLKIYSTNIQQTLNPEDIIRATSYSTKNLFTGYGVKADLVWDNIIYFTPYSTKPVNTHIV